VAGRKSLLVGYLDKTCLDACRVIIFYRQDHAPYTKLRQRDGDQQVTPGNNVHQKQEWIRTPIFVTLVVGNNSRRRISINYNRLSTNLDRKLPKTARVTASPQELSFCVRLTVTIDNMHDLQEERS
jgi:hypothetical protein